MNIAVKDILRNRSYYKNRLKCILPYLDVYGSSILDLGCGEMLLKELVTAQNTSYLGIDHYKFSDSCDFIIGDISDKTTLENKSADFVFLLGILDHFPQEKKESLLQWCKGCYTKSLIISQRNPACVLNLFQVSLSPAMNLDDYFRNTHIRKLHLLKLPLFQFVIDLTNFQGWMKRLSTEIIYIVSRER